MRVVIPLSARAQILDALLSARVNLVMDGFDKPGWFIAAVAGTQPMDIAFGITQMVEKSMDDWSRGGFASMDIASYYDNIDVVLICRWLAARHAVECDAAVIGAILRWQLLPTISVDAGVCEFVVQGRTRGGITGSRLAGALGRIPVESTMQQCSTSVARWSYHLGARRGLSGASFVDNLFFFSHSLGGALNSAKCFEECLANDWHLRIKEGSREALLVAGCPELAVLDDVAVAWPSWRFVESLRCLGVRVSWDGSVKDDLQEWRAAVLMAVARNASGIVRKCFSEDARLRLARIFAQPLLDYRACRWPCTPAVGRFVDAVQRRVVASMLEVPRLPGEDIDAWQRRRSRRAGAVARRWGLWSLRHQSRALDWYHHLCRDHVPSMAAAALRWRGATWRRQRRLMQGSSSSEAGRLGSRVLTHVNARWEDALP